MPYQNGYDVLPKLGKLSGPIFNDDKALFLQEKRKAIQKQQCFFEHNCTEEIRQVVSNYISVQTGLQGSFDQIALQLREDLVVHRIDDNQDFVCLAHICFPSNWHPEEKIGKSFVEIHQDVPLMRLDNSKKLVEAMIYKSPYERSVWTIIFEYSINGHPIYQKKEFDIKNPEIYVRWERQIIIGFPEIKAVLFVICQNIIEENDINKNALYQSLKNMKREHILYKGLDKSYDNVLKYLKETATFEEQT
jgi:hypothetical protein